MSEPQTAPIKISGTIDRFIYHNQENGYAVCIVTIEQTAIYYGCRHFAPHHTRPRG